MGVREGSPEEGTFEFCVTLFLEKNHKSGVGFGTGSTGIYSCSGLRPHLCQLRFFRFPGLLLGDLMQGEL